MTEAQVPAPPARPIRVLVVDDHGPARVFVVTCLTDAGIAVVAEAGSGAEAVALHARHHPEVVTLDLIMPGLEPVEAIRQIRGQDGEARVLVLSAMGNPRTVMSALRAGARGFVLKPFAPPQLVDAVIRLATFDRRRSPRLPLRGRVVSASLSAVDSGGAVIEVRGTAVELSFGGLRVRLGEGQSVPLIGQALAIRLCLGDDDILANARVVWAGRGEVGLEFLSLPAAVLDRLEAALAERLEGRSRDAWF